VVQEDSIQCAAFNEARLRRRIPIVIRRLYGPSSLGIHQRSKEMCRYSENCKKT